MSGERIDGAGCAVVRGKDRKEWPQRRRLGLELIGVPIPSSLLLTCDGLVVERSGVICSLGSQICEMCAGLTALGASSLRIGEATVSMSTYTAQLS